jgi:hypothetical protein
MGRPINKKFFGNTNLPSYGSEQQGSGVGGEGVASIAIATTGTLYTTSTTLSATFTAPQIKGGVRASASVTTDATGNTTAVTLLTAGSGYTSTPTATLSATTGTTATFTVVLTSTRQNAIAFTSYLTTGSNAVTGGDIIKQESSRRYLVQNSEGRGQVKLVATDTLTAGTMKIIATDGAGSTFFVKKLTANKATLTVRTGTSTAVVTGGTAGWTLGAATGTNQVTLGNN